MPGSPSTTRADACPARAASISAVIRASSATTSTSEILIALELYAPNARMAAALHELRTRDVSRDEVLAMAEQLAGTTHAVRGR